ncbi:MAG: PQQ-binding-like beta-propeller repeat protein [Opitutales bacterium]|jgi:outer membrane protein assembly factor BamB
MTTINLDKALKINIPRVTPDLSPVSFETSDGLSGWFTHFPGSRPIATPAYDKSLLFVGGGYGSYEFVALDAASGEVVWRTTTADDGPTAAVVEDDLVAFNTESCSIIVCRTQTGEVVWQEWLGDPLMSQPAIDKGKLFLAYPTGQRQGSPIRGHAMLCADLRTGRHVWEQEITGDVMTAPVISDDQLFFTCFDGTAFCLDAESGKVEWRERTDSTAAPLVVEDEVIMPEKRQTRQQVEEPVWRRNRNTGERSHAEAMMIKEAAFLGVGESMSTGLDNDYCADLDGSVGFASAPHAAKLNAAHRHVGVSTVAAAWAYQGSRASYGKGKFYQAGSGSVDCTDKKTGQSWKTKFTGKDVNLDDQIFLPPSMGKDYLYLGSRYGHLVSVNQDTGSTGFCYQTSHPMSFQPCLAEGSIYVGTNHGGLLCLKTGQNDASDWHMWGGNAQHNKTS